MGKWHGIVTRYFTLEDCEKGEGKGICINRNPDEYVRAFAVMEGNNQDNNDRKDPAKSRVAKSRKRDHGGRFI